MLNLFLTISAILACVVVSIGAIMLTKETYLDARYSTSTEKAITILIWIIALGLIGFVYNSFPSSIEIQIGIFWGE